jgi:hypothetical protein
MPRPTDHVKKHLHKNGVQPGELPDKVIEALNTFSEAELKKLDDLGDALDTGGVPPAKAISAVH